MPITLTSKEIRNGIAYLALNLLLLPGLVSMVGLGLGLDMAGINFCYYFLNFAFVLWIFRKFLWGNVLVALDRLFPVLWYGILGYLGYETVTNLVSALIFLINPAFVNFNDATVASMVTQSPLLAFSVIALVPLAEETLYRGLVFRGLYEKNHILAYCVSMAFFSAIHVVGYADVLSPAQLLFSFIQYLPAGYCLCFVYRRSGTIITPIAVHMAINAMAVLAHVR